MAEYTAELYWERGEATFTNKRYSRKHSWRFDGGLTVPGSSSPSVVPVPMSDPAAVDPEEAFIAALSSCHLLWFLALAADRNYSVERYRDRPVGRLAKNAQGRYAMAVVTLRPEVAFSGPAQPTSDQIADLHSRAHEECFIANSVTTDVRCEPVFATPQE